jgi:serine/threonine-protein kinase
MSIDRYVIERELGRGATAFVYLARDRDAGRMVALKLMRDELVGTISTERFFKEIQRTGELQHPHIVPLLASGEHDGRPFCVLPFMDGGTLRQRLEKEKQLPLADAVAICGQVARALAFAHGRNLIHRDVKPENILFTAGQATLADFGIARALERSSGGESTTSTGIVRGTPAYMSPEQAVGETTLDARTDIYSLGCVLYEIIAGVPAFVGPTSQAIVAQRLNHPPRSLHIYRPSVPLALEAIVEKMLAPSPADRYRTCGEVADALAAVDLGGATSLSTGVAPENESSRILAILLTGGALLAAAGIALYVKTTPATTGTVPPADPHRVAVLYFENQSPDRLPGYVVDGLSEEITDRLASVRPLVVSSPNAVRRFRGSNAGVDSIARTLKVGLLASGSIAQSGSSMRIAIRLIDGSSGQQVGTASMDAPIASAFTISGELASRVAQLIRQRVGDVVADRIVGAQTSSAKAWSLVQQATAVSAGGIAEGMRSNRAGSEAEQYRQANDLLLQAQALDPAWPAPLIKRARLVAMIPPQTALAPPGVDTIQFSRMPPPFRVLAWRTHEVELLNAALRLDPGSVDALALRGAAFNVMAAYSRNPDSLTTLAEQDERAAARLQPNSPLAWLTLANIALRTGRFGESADDARLAYQADAFFEIPQVAQTGFLASLRAQRFAEAADWCTIGQTANSGNPQFAECRLTLLGWMGKRRADLDSAWREVRAIETRDTVHMLAATAPYRRLLVAFVAARAGLRDSARSIQRSVESGQFLMESAYLDLLCGDDSSAVAKLATLANQRPASKRQIAQHPWFATLRDDRRFNQLVR